MDAKQPRYPGSIIEDLMIDGLLTQGGSISGGFSGSYLQCPIDTPYGEFETNPLNFYLAYVGRVRANITIDYAKFRITTPATGAFTSGQIAFLSGGDPVATTLSTVTVNLVSLPGLVDLTTSGNKTVPVNKSFYQNTNLWVGFFIRYATTQPKFFPLGRDYGAGFVRVGTTVIDDPFTVDLACETAIAADNDQTGIDFLLHASPW